MSKALVLSGGGARAAYQIGVLRRVAELSVQIKPQCPFPILCGTSAGAVNVSVIASRFDNFRLTTRALETVWRNFRVYQIYRTDVGSLFNITTKWVRDLGLGGLLGGGHIKSLLDTAPLQRLVNRVINFERVKGALDKGELRALAINATSYSTGNTVTFISTNSDITPWKRVRRVGVISPIRSEHVLASSAIPLIFPAIKVGNEYYGDGSIRFHTPLSPAARLGAKKILAVGVRHGNVETSPPSQSFSYPSIGQMASIVLNSIFLDNMDADWENLQRINELLDASANGAELKGRGTAQKIVGCYVRPTEDLGKIAVHFEKRLPITIRYFLRGLGVGKEEGADITSYLLFDKEYTRTLIDLGYHNACTMDDQIATLLED